MEKHFQFKLAPEQSKQLMNKLTEHGKGFSYHRDTPTNYGSKDSGMKGRTITWLDEQAGKIVSVCSFDIPEEGTFVNYAPSDYEPLRKLIDTCLEDFR